ncbi:MAG TPA: NAD-dependent epimerase/dehydratase family protein [Xanthobacteraceae bacterium]|nr:NAD-dependent epimerase/dehydratase family protein [Xanthobacteraceae bacterium]
MKVLVTGGAGFIGIHLTKRLLADGHDVFVVDNESNGDPSLVPAAAKYTRGDVTKPEEVEPIFAAGIDAVCHIAGQVSIIKAFSDPVADLRTNTEGTVQILKLCVKHKVPRLLYASSMTLYGDCKVVPTPESEPCVPDSYYGITKFAAERYVHSTAERPDLGFDFSVTSLRMFSVFGPGQSYNNPYQGVLGIFSGNILRGEPITIFGDGEQTRDFIFVEDIVDGWSRALVAPKAKGQIINLGGGRSTSINQLADAVVGAFGFAKGGYEIRHAPGRPGEQRAVQADIRKANELIGWSPRTSFEEGLKKTVAWAKSEFEKSGAVPGGRK